MASSWAFRFSASLLAYEEKGGGQAVMGMEEVSGERGFPLLLRLSLKNRGSREVTGNYHGEKQIEHPQMRKQAFTFAFRTLLFHRSTS